MKLFNMYTYVDYGWNITCSSKFVYISVDDFIGSKSENILQNIFLQNCH